MFRCRINFFYKRKFSSLYRICIDFNQLHLNSLHMKLLKYFKIIEKKPAARIPSILKIIKRQTKRKKMKKHMNKISQNYFTCASIAAVFPQFAAGWTLAHLPRPPQILRWADLSGILSELLTHTISLKLIALQSRWNMMDFSHSILIQLRYVWLDYDALHAHKYVRK